MPTLSGRKRLSNRNPRGRGTHRSRHLPFPGQFGRNRNVMKRGFLVAPYFIPCTLAGVHRARLLANGLPEFGWEPTVLTVDPRHYGSLNEPDLAALIPAGLRIEYAGPLPAVL